MKYIVLFVTGMIIPSSAAQYECVRWTWTGDVYNRKVVCLEWRKQDCSNRLHKIICKGNKQ
jgi:hypothetical protein